uniref:Phosphagen kinase C-terminal domain-containing protein n=1 Tax=Ditylum brightwellii TaxID=49249 RepID=A0A7S4QQL5_9STRA
MTFYKCIRTGVDNPDSGLGCYAMTPTDYSKFGGFFDKVIRDYHGDESGSKKHETDWDTDDADYDVKKLGQDELSMRVRVGRNLLGFNLKSAGISSDWPYGRGCWQSEDKMRIIWFGEEDQLRIMCMKKGSNLLEVFSNLNEMLSTVESIEGIEFAKDEQYGYVTSCPSNLGTGMRASVHVKIPNLTADGTDAKAKEVCKPLGLSVRGTGGEHTPIGADGTVDISPSARLFIKEKEIIGKLYEGIEKLMAIENA